MRSIVFKGIKEATLRNSYENCLATQTDQSFMHSREGEKHIQRVRQPVTETRSETNVPDTNTVDWA